jgi:integrase
MIRRVERDGGVRFQVYGRRDGKKVYIGTYDSKREALAVEEDDRVTQRKIDAGQLPPLVDGKRTFGTAVEAWLKTIEHTPSHDKYRDRIELYAMPRFRDVPIVDIRKSDVVAWRDELAEGKISIPTVNSARWALSSAFTYFVDRDWIPVNPCRGVKVLKHDARVFPWLESPDAITRLLAELAPKWRTLVAFLVGTGCRLDEALNLRWDDVDLEHRLVTLRKTKARKPRRVPIFDAVLPVLKEMKLARGGEPYLWPGQQKGSRLSQAAIRQPFKLAVTSAGLPKELRLHDLRHTFASLFLIDGGDIFKLSRILGHHSVVITERTYAHLKRTAYEEDYGRVRFTMPTGAKVIRLVAGDARETRRD